MVQADRDQIALVTADHAGTTATRRGPVPIDPKFLTSISGGTGEYKLPAGTWVVAPPSNPSDLPAGTW